MNATELYQKLKEAYSEQNLNKITLTLINLYKEQQFATLQHIAAIIAETVKIEITPDGKGFSKFMMLYHPDRGSYFRTEIERLASAEDLDGLLGYSHILLLSRIEEVANTLESYEDIDYSPVYEWDFNSDGFSVVSEDEQETLNSPTQYENSDRRYSFYEALQIRMYGNTEIEFPTYYLEDMDEFELAFSDIDNLYGAQYCLHAITMDLSSNFIGDLFEISELYLLEELNLSDNKIFDINFLAGLKHMKSLDLSNNDIDDISPLFDLQNLEYVNISGNNIPQTQIEELQELGVTVVSEG